jgi:hypothetical protein
MSVFVFIAGDIDRSLWAGGIRPVRLSKYATSMAALRPPISPATAGAAP